MPYFIGGEITDRNQVCGYLVTQAHVTYYLSFVDRLIPDTSIPINVRSQMAVQTPASLRRRFNIDG